MTVFPALSMLKTSASESYEIFVLVFFFILRSFTWIKRDDDFCVSLNFVHYAQDSSFIEANLCNQERQPTIVHSVGLFHSLNNLPFSHRKAVPSQYRKLPERMCRKSNLHALYHTASIRDVSARRESKSWSSSPFGRPKLR